MCDADAQWGPLLFLRPPREQRFGWARVTLLALIVGTVLGGFGSLCLAVMARVTDQAPYPGYAFPLVLTLAYFCAYALFIAPAWDRRALRLERLRDYR